MRLWHIILNLLQNDNVKYLIDNHTDIVLKVADELHNNKIKYENGSNEVRFMHPSIVDIFTLNNVLYAEGNVAKILIQKNELVNAFADLYEKHFGEDKIDINNPAKLEQRNVRLDKMLEIVGMLKNTDNFNQPISVRGESKEYSMLNIIAYALQTMENGIGTNQNLKNMVTQIVRRQA